MLFIFLVVLDGCPFAGKTTLVKTLQHEYGHLIERCSFSDQRYYSQEQYANVSQYFLAKMKYLQDFYNQSANIATLRDQWPASMLPYMAEETCDYNLSDNAAREGPVRLAAFLLSQIIHQMVRSHIDTHERTVCVVLTGRFDKMNLPASDRRILIRLINLYCGYRRQYGSNKFDFIEVQRIEDARECVLQYLTGNQSQQSTSATAAIDIPEEPSSATASAHSEDDTRSLPEELLEVGDEDQQTPPEIDFYADSVTIDNTDNAVTNNE